MPALEVQIFTDIFLVISVEKVVNSRDDLKGSPRIWSMLHEKASTSTEDSVDLQ